MAWDWVFTRGEVCRSRILLTVNQPVGRIPVRALETYGNKKGWMGKETWLPAGKMGTSRRPARRPAFRRRLEERISKFLCPISNELKH